MNFDQDHVPSTVTAAVGDIVATLDADDILYIKSDHNSSSVHHGIGMHIRNAWSLWDAVNTYGIAHADDISSLIWAWVWASVREEPFDPLKYVETYHEHWRKQGTNSLEAGGWKE